MPRAQITNQVSIEVALLGRRRCALCFGLNADQSVKSGQLAHIDRDSSRSTANDLAWLCLDHHDQYDSRASQSRGFSPGELRAYRDELYAIIATSRATLVADASHPAFTPEAFAVASYFVVNSVDGRQWDPQISLQDLATALAMTNSAVVTAVEDLSDLGLVGTDGSMVIAYPEDRMFWELDPLVVGADPVRDAVDVAKFVVAQSDDFVDLSDIGSGLGWGPRRVNPAVTLLVARGIVEPRAAMGSAPWALLSVVRTPTTRRFARDAT